MKVVSTFFKNSLDVTNLSWNAKNDGMKPDSVPTVFLLTYITRGKNPLMIFIFILNSYILKGLDL